MAWLDGHQNLEAMLANKRLAVPDLSRMRRAVDIMGHPESTAPAIHVTGTNGKTSTTRALTELLMAKGLSVGTYTSPHLERINERISVNGEPISDSDLAALLGDIARLEPLLGELGRLTWFEILTLGALGWFADSPVDAMVIEVGLGGRWDATNVVDAGVAVVTGIGLDHVELLGPTRRDIAGEKAGIIKPGATVVVGERDPELLGIFEGESPEVLWWAGRDYACERNQLSVGGRLLDLRTPGGSYQGVWLDLHGAHQGDNFATALCAAEAFFASPIEDALVRAAAASLRSPGRMEVMGHQPLILLDGAKNPEGAKSAYDALSEEFLTSGSLILVVGMLVGKDPAEMLDALGAGQARLVVACPPPSPRAQPAEVVASAARALGARSEVAGSVPEALGLALDAAGPTDVVLVAGSLYVVGAARSALRARSA